MDFRSNTNSSIFTNRELRRYRSLYRSRTLLRAQQVEITNRNEVSITLFGSIALLSASIRPLIRKNFTNNSWQYKVYLFSNSLSQAFTSISYLKERGSLLKGSSFYRTITFTLPKNQPIYNEYAYISKQLCEIFNRFDLINKSTSESSAEVAFLNPILIYRPTKFGIITPRRFSEARRYIYQEISNFDILNQQLKYLNSPVINRYQLRIKPQLSILSKPFYIRLLVFTIYI